MYHQYFGLTESAFSIAVNPRYLYMSGQHKEALAHLLYGVNSGGFVLLTGEVGTGKTTIIRSLLEKIPDNTDLAMVLNPMASVPEMIAGICDELGIHYDKSSLQQANNTTNKNLIDALYNYLLENHRAGRNTVLLIDEAQLLTPEALEQIRLLTNLETNTKKLLQIVLVGQPELNKVLSQPRLRQLAQRITAKFHLHPLTQPETEAYISHRLQVAGLTLDRNPFTKPIIKKIHRFTGGIPRRINILCERIMLGLYGYNKQQVDNRVFSAAVKEVMGNMADDKKMPGRFAVLLKNSLIALLLIAFIFVAYMVMKHYVFSNDVIAHVPKATNTVANKTEPSSSNLDTKNNNNTYNVKRLIDAQNLLFEYLNINNDPDIHPCWSKGKSNKQCETTTLATWEALRAINRPTVLTINTTDKFTAYVVLIKITGTVATVLDMEANRQEVDLSVLGERWTGRVFYLWQRPPAFKGPVSLGDTGETVTWLAEQFALIDQQDTPLANLEYTRALQERVKIFQTQSGLNADGILGVQTVLKLNEVLGLDRTLIDNRGIDHVINP